MSSTTFGVWYGMLMPWEGTVQDWEAIPANQFDRGGLTHGGVTIATWEDAARRYGWQAGESGLRTMTQAQHKQIAYDMYWLPCAAPSLPPGVDIYHADTAWGSGPHAAARMLQRALNDTGAQLLVDGQIGPLTIAAARRTIATALLGAYHAQRTAFLRRIVQLDPTQSVFLAGWLARTEACYKLSLPYTL